MENLIRENLSINVKIIDLLNEQIKMEAKASATYLAMASWCDQQGFDYSAKFFYDQSNEEREHMLKIFKFINDNGGIAYSPEVPKVNHEYESILDLYKTALQEEIAVSKSIQQIFLTCRKENDVPTELFLQWFINEQLEEEQKMRHAIKIYELHGDDAENLYVLDKRISRE
ncbi:ferritin [Ascidiimonas aurantiaca]|uniref:ferritin n=1 Tax=Ascidiimonas aurantiaca TaxID=1685432 RepID=UPI0030ECF1C1